MNVFYDHTIFQQVYGGISRYFRELIVRLSDEEGVGVHLFMGLFANRYGLENLKNRCKGYWGRPMLPLPRTGRAIRLLNGVMWRFFQAKFAPAGGKGAVYHPTYYDFSGLPKAKVVFTVHDFTHERFPRLFPKGDKTPALKRRAFLSRADALICVSESTKNDLLNFYGPDIKCPVKAIHHGCNDLSALPAPPLSLPDYPYFLFVGPRHEYKNFERLLTALASSADLKNNFGVACFGGTRFSTAEKQCFAEFGLAGKIAYYEGGDGALSVLYKNALALVFPSFYEGFGFPILEAMSCGCPVVASGASSIPEVTGESALLFEPSSAEDLAEQLRKVAFKDDVRTRLIELGKRRCTLFSWNRCLKETLEFYRSL
ncbi:MAG: glycosyltransferase family 4 protein [Synergistaceae bacterium]|jgi:glycosyltransferase involved in cell wall biosynthesis|nr:glycosyltransferase family 4 protein [Synergistaceae bacterium]